MASPPDAATRTAATARSVDFYVLPGTDGRARLKLACRLAEQAYLNSSRVLVWSDDAAELSAFDELLWTFADRSFVPHEPYRDATQWHEVPVLLSAVDRLEADTSCDVLLNLGRTVPDGADCATRIIEVIDADEARRQAGRVRFRAYRDQGMQPKTHHVTADQTG